MSPRERRQRVRYIPPLPSPAAPLPPLIAAALARIVNARRDGIKAREAEIAEGRAEVAAHVKDARSAATAAAWYAEKEGSLRGYRAAMAEVEDLLGEWGAVPDAEKEEKSV